MKFLGIALVVLVCVSVAVVEGRKDHKRGKKEHMRWESRREQIGNMRPKMMRISKAQQTAKANVGEVQANNDAAAKQGEAKPNAVGKSDAELEARLVHIAEKEKRGHKRRGPHHEDEAKRHREHNRSHRLHHGALHKRHPDNREPHHINDVRMIKLMKKAKGKAGHEMLELEDLPNGKHIDWRRVMKMVKKYKKHMESNNDSRGETKKNAP